MFKERYVSIMELPTEIKYEFIEADMSTLSDEDLREIFRDVDVVFDLAGITNVPLSFEKKKLAMDVNYVGWKKLLDYAIKNNVRKFVYSSSAGVYGSTEGIVTEEHDCRPSSPYAETKLLAENECIKAHTNCGLDVTILRLGTVYGFTVGMRFDTVVNRFVYLACIGKPLSVWIEAEKAKRPYVHVNDAIRGFLFVAVDKRTKGEIYNLVGQNASLSEVVEAIRKYVPNVRIKPTHVTEALGQLSYMIDDSKIRKLGFKTRYSLDDGIRELVDKFRALLHT